MQRQMQGTLWARPVLALAMCLSGTALAQPDLTGVYGAYAGADPAAARIDVAMQEQAQSRVDEVRFILEGTGETSGEWCLGSGMPASLMGSGAYPMEIIQRPEQITIIYEAHNELRRIYLDPERRLPLEARFEDRNGYSEGHWEGDTLVVETTHLKEQLDGRYPHSANARITERYQLQSGPQGESLLVAELRMEDPDFYLDTVELKKTWLRDPAAHMLPYECNEASWLERLEALREEKLP